MADSRMYVVRIESNQVIQLTLPDGKTESLHDVHAYLAGETSRGLSPVREHARRFNTIPEAQVAAMNFMINGHNGDLSYVIEFEDE